jgi:hypothetical protein
VAKQEAVPTVALTEATAARVVTTVAVPATAARVAIADRRASAR